MDNLKLLIPDASHAAQIMAYRQAFLELGDDMDGTSGLRQFEDPQQWLTLIEKMRTPATVPAHLVPATQFICLRESDQVIVGMLQVRHTMNDYIRAYAGHIGYSVRPDERKKGIATWMLKSVLPFCKSLGLNRVMVSCFDTNEASRRTILTCGGVYDSTAFEPQRQKNIEKYWITL